MSEKSGEKNPEENPPAGNSGEARDTSLSQPDFPLRRCVSESELDTKRKAMSNKVDKIVQVDMDSNPGIDLAGKESVIRELEQSIKAKCLELQRALATNKQLHDIQVKLLDENARFRSMLRQDDNDIVKVDIDPMPTYSFQSDEDEEEDYDSNEDNDYFQDDDSEST